MSFRLIHFLCKISCVMPLKSNTKGFFEDDVVFLRWSLICMCLAAIESGYSAYTLLRDVTHSTLHHSEKVSSMLSVIAKLVTLTQICAITGKLILGRRKLIELSNLLIQVKFRLFKKQNFSKEVLLTCVVMNLATFNTFFAYIQPKNLTGVDGWQLFVNALEPLIKFVSCFVLSGVNLQFWGFCQTMREGFKEINNQLLEITAAFKGKRVKSYKYILVTMSKLRACRSHLCEAVDKLNELFGICVLLALLFYNIYVHVVVYLVLTEVIDFIYDASNEMDFGSAPVWLAIDIFFISTYFQGCIRTSREMEKTTKILSNMSHSLPSGSLRDNVYWFLTEVNARPIIFSAYGVFRIDLPLLFVSVASCAVNMAILLQNSD